MARTPPCQIAKPKAVSVKAINTGFPTKWWLMMAPHNNKWYIVDVDYILSVYDIDERALDSTNSALKRLRAAWYCSILWILDMQCTIQVNAILPPQKFLYWLFSTHWRHNTKIDSRWFDTVKSIIELDELANLMLILANAAKLPPFLLLVIKTIIRRLNNAVFTQPGFRYYAVPRWYKHEQLSWERRHAGKTPVGRSCGYGLGPAASLI